MGGRGGVKMVGEDKAFCRGVGVGVIGWRGSIFLLVGGRGRPLNHNNVGEIELLLRHCA